MTQYLLKMSLSQTAIERIAQAFSNIYPAFNSEDFHQHSLQGLDALALKQRVQHLISTLHRQLPSDFTQAAPLLQAAAANWPAANADEKYPAFAAWPVIDYVAHHGLNHPQIAVPLLKQLTPLFSAEFAIQPFIQQHFEHTYPHLLQWCEDDNEHVRRLASEGMRPRLPWGLRMQALCHDPAPILPILHTLKNDPSLYVRKSVANNINDISKDNPDIAMALCEQWLPQATTNTQWIIRHGLRTLVKQGNAQALALLGYKAARQIQVEQLQTDKPALSVGDDLQLSFSIRNNSRTTQKLVIDYAVHYVRQKGKTAQKVFKLTNTELPASETHTLQKTVSFKPVSTRRYYAGEHRIDVLINGVIASSVSFMLE